jgi:acetyltransferase-like isoleucine patch superfamily enzyme
MKLKDMPAAARRRLSGYLLGIRHSSKVSFASPPVVDGRWPQFNGPGTFKFGTRCTFKNFRLPQSVVAFAGGTLEVGDDTFMNDGVTICAAKSIKIGRHVMLADMVYLYDTDFHAVTPGSPVRKAPISIGNNVWVCANSMILAGTTIGDHSVVAAGSVVTGEVPPKSIVAGSPARVIRTFECKDDWIRSREPE